jgi:hypothetical protein
MADRPVVAPVDARIRMAHQLREGRTMNSKMVTARKRHRCAWCWEWIDTGTRYIWRTDFSDAPTTVRMHPECYEAAGKVDLDGELPTPGTYRRGCWCQERPEDCNCGDNPDNRVLFMAGKMQERMFPMQHGPDIPWSIAEEIYDLYAFLFGSDQSMERMAERGGFSWGEVGLFYTHRKYPKWKRNRA